MWTEFCAHTHNFAKNSSLTLVSWNIGGDQAMEQLLVFLNRGRCFFALTLLPSIQCCRVVCTQEYLDVQITN